MLLKVIYISKIRTDLGENSKTNQNFKYIYIKNIIIEFKESDAT